jgi:hypothetical protein
MTSAAMYTASLGPAHAADRLKAPGIDVTPEAVEARAADYSMGGAIRLPGHWRHHGQRRRARPRYGPGSEQ